jgi:hypothetical protein
VVPLAVLGEFLAHEQELLARVGPQVGVEQAQVGEALPLVARHLAQERALPVHHLVVREGEHEILAVGIELAEGELLVVIGAEHRVELEIGERVVHPTHVPLHREAEAPEIRRPRHQRPGGGFLGDDKRARVALVDDAVQLAQEGDRIDDCAAALRMRHGTSKSPWRPRARGD